MRKTVLIMLAVAVPAFLAAPLLFPVSADVPEPSSGQMPLFLLLSVVESLALGLAVAIAVRAPRVIRLLPAPEQRPATVATVAAVWFLGNWWVHDGLHMMAGLHIGRLLAIEYAFHVTLMVAGAALVGALGRLAGLRSPALTG
jgi:hypothetical protein